MEVDDKSLPIEAKILGEYAYSYHAYAKALHYKEIESFQGRSPAIYESLIGINTQLQQHDAALGTLVVARELYDSKHEEWYEKLGKWEDALQAYNCKTGEEAEAREVVIGKMRCGSNLSCYIALPNAMHQMLACTWRVGAACFDG